MSVLEVRNISHTYIKNKQQIHALKSVSFSLEKGEIMGVVGESGCGKSTLLKQISGIETPDSGDILIHGSVPEGKNLKSRRKRYSTMQMIFQNPLESFDPRRKIITSMEENLRFLAGIISKKEQEEIIYSYMEKVDLKKDLLLRYPRELSGGQCQRAAIARAIMIQPEILLCDEITSALDVIVQDKIIRQLKELVRQQEISVIFVSHDIALVSSFCDRIMVMLNGECVEQGNTKDIMTSPQSEYTKVLLDSVLEL